MNFRLTRLNPNILAITRRICSLQVQRPFPRVSVSLRHKNVLKHLAIPLQDRRIFSSPRNDYSEVPDESSLDNATYLRICADTLDALCDYFEVLVEKESELDSGTDVSYGDGVLTVKLGQHGTYVINRQTPNKQIWLSSPTSGPKRFDFVGTDEKGEWIYKHTGQSMHDLLQNEIKAIFKTQNINFYELPYGKG